MKRLKDVGSTCSISLCKQNVFVSLKKATSEELKMTLTSAGLQCTTTEVPIPTPLCKHHYHLVYNMLQPTQTHCVTCDVSLRHSKTKPCPEPEIIKKYLHDNASYDGDINEHDKVCYACYRAHLVILKQKDKLISSEADLKDIITTLSSQVSVYRNKIWSGSH